MKQNPFQVIEQAQASHKQFFADYGDPNLLEQADLTTATSGVLNKVTSRAVWAQLNTSVQAVGVIPKTRRTKASPPGWRAKTAFASTGKGGVAEGTVPTAVVGSYAEVFPTIIEHATQMRVTGLQQDLADVEDAYGTIAQIAEELSAEHGKEMERAITEDADTLAGVNCESLDRVTTSSAAVTDLGYTAGDEDIFGIDRSAAAWADAYINYNASAGAGVARVFALSQLDDLIRGVGKNTGMAGAGMVFLTGWDTWERVSQLEASNGRYDKTSVKSATGKKVGESEVSEGFEISTLINHYNGRPIVVSDQIQDDGLSRVYLLDTSNPENLDKPRLGMDILRPTQVYLAGERSSGAPQAIGALADSALAVSRYQLGCRFFKAQGQLRDLKVS